MQLATSHRTADDQGEFLDYAIEERGRDLFYAPSESIFGAVAEHMVGLGWSIMPQQSEGRFPGRVWGETIRWGAEGHDLKNRRVDPKSLKLWAGHCATLNVACVFGPASGHTFAIDIDVTDVAMVRQITALANQTLGYTPFRRVGRAPKLALLYRHAHDDVVRSIARTLVAGDGAHMVELQGAGKLLTCHGKHHKTGRYFKWLDANPILDGPDLVPLVTSVQVTAFMMAVETAFGFMRSAAASTGSVLLTGSEDVSGLKMPSAAGERLTEGRYHVSNGVAFATVRMNAAEVYAAVSAGTVTELKGRLTAVAVAVFEAAAEYGGRWTPEYVAKELGGNIARTIDRVVRGDLVLTVPRPTPVHDPGPGSGPRPLVRTVAARPTRSLVRPAGPRR